MDIKTKDDLINAQDDYEVVTESVRKYALASTSTVRYEHSVRVAKTCAMLCIHFNLNEKKGYLAGIGHDICKGMGDRLLISLAKKDGMPIRKIEKDKPSLLHGRAAAVKLRNDFGITDNEIIEAVAYHTFGYENMCDLAKLLYVADKIEPGRDYVTQEFIDRLLQMSLNDMTRFIVKQNIDYIEKKGHLVATDTKKFYKSLVCKT